MELSLSQYYHHLYNRDKVTEEVDQANTQTPVHFLLSRSKCSNAISWNWYKYVSLRSIRMRITEFHAPTDLEWKIGSKYWGSCCSPPIAYFQAQQQWTASLYAELKNRQLGVPDAGNICRKPLSGPWSPPLTWSEHKKGKPCTFVGLEHTHTHTCTRTRTHKANILLAPNCMHLRDRGLKSWLLTISGTQTSNEPTSSSDPEVLSRMLMVAMVVDLINKATYKLHWSACN